MKDGNVRTNCARGALICALMALGAATALARDPFYEQKNLVSDGFIRAKYTDPNLVNAWGIVPNPTGVWWVANEGSGTSTLYDGNGAPQSLVVDVPPAPGIDGPGAPTGIVFNGSDDFVIIDGAGSGPARFIFAGADGIIAAWAPGVPPPPPSTQAIVMIDNSAGGASYFGVAIASNSTGRMLYAANFGNGRIDVFNSTFAAVGTGGSFTDPNLPSGYAPFAIHAIGARLFVAYAQRDDGGEEVVGPGLGIVDTFDTDGNLLARFASHGVLNAPWGIVQAPANFGPLSNAILVGNFGDGHINAFDAATGAPLGAIANKLGEPLEIEGLWGIQFGNGGQAGPTNTLYFGAGPEDEAHGLFGRIDAVIPR